MVVNLSDKERAEFNGRHGAKVDRLHHRTFALMLAECPVAL
jgi:hypothetical protein